MADFGDALRGYASVLSPQVAQDVAQEDQQKRQLQSQAQLMQFKQALEQQTPEYQAKVEALKNEKAFRDAATNAGGDMTKIAAAAAQYGKPDLAVNIYNHQEQKAARLQQAHDALEARRSELEMKINDKALDREQKARYDAMMGELKAQGLAMQGEIAKGNQELKKMQFAMQGDKALVQQTHQLGAALEKANLPEADAVLGAVEDALKKHPDLAGYLAGPKSLLPDMVIGTDLAAGKQAFQKLFNITLKNRSGSAVTNQELERLKQEFATGTFKTAPQLQKAVEQARNIINKHYTSVAAGYGPKALEAYNENMRGLGGRVALEVPKSTEWSVEEIK